MIFKFNSQVRWTSQAGGRWKEKHGRVFRVISPYERPIGYSGSARNHESYLIEVREGKRKPKLYWPEVKRLERVGR